jgi:prolyl-tRNA synthetase
MVHGDDNGLVLPPGIAPTQVIVIPIGSKNELKHVLFSVNQIKEQLKSQEIRVKLDDRDNYSPGWKFNEYELKGVPIRLEIGPRDLNQEQVVLARRDTGEKIIVPISKLHEKIEELLSDIQLNLFKKAKAFLEQNSHIAETLGEMTQIINTQRSFVLAGWCGDDRCESTVKQTCGATSRNIPFTPPRKISKCVTCGSEAKYTVWFAKSY